MKIIGTGKALPNLKVTNDMLAQFLDTNDSWISTRTGIKERRLLSTETLDELAVKASDAALQDANLKASDIDFIICSNVANSYVTPGLGCIIQGKIDATCPCIDINCACTGFINALDIAESFFQTKKEIKNILIVCAEEPSRFTNWKERDTSVLFGDGAGAVVLTRGDDMKAIVLSSSSKTDVLYYKRKLENTPYKKTEDDTKPLVMVGKEVFKMAVTSSVSDIETVMKQAGITPEDVKYFILHQANIRIIDAIRQHLEQPTEKFPHNIEKYGNTSSASIPILLDEMKKENKIKAGDTLIFSAFGAGFTTGACVIKWSDN